MSHPTPDKPQFKSLFAQGIYEQTVEYEQYVSAPTLATISQDNRHNQRISHHQVRFSKGYTKLKFDSSPYAIYQNVYTPTTLTNRIHSLSLEALRPSVKTYARQEIDEASKPINAGVKDPALLKEIVNSFNPEIRKQRREQMIIDQRKTGATMASHFITDDDSMMINLADEFETNGDEIIVQENDLGDMNGMGFDDLFNSILNGNIGATTSTADTTTHQHMNTFTGDFGMDIALRDDDGLIIDDFDSIFANIDTTDTKKPINKRKDIPQDEFGLNLEAGDVYGVNTNSFDDVSHIKTLLSTANIVDDAKAQELKKQRKKEAKMEKYLQEEGILTAEEERRIKRQRILDQMKS